MAVRCYSGDGSYTTKQYQAPGETIQAAMKNVLDQVFKTLQYTPERLEFRPQRRISQTEEVNFDDWSPEYKRFRSCSVKKPYVIEAHASADAKSMNRTRKPELPEEKVYKCAYCGFFHVGSLKLPLPKPAITQN